MNLLESRKAKRIGQLKVKHDDVYRMLAGDFSSFGKGIPVMQGKILYARVFHVIPKEEYIFIKVFYEENMIARQ